MTRVLVSETLCSGHALCHAYAPEVYDLDDEGYCAVSGEQVPEELLAAAEHGALACPEQAITLRD